MKRNLIILVPTVAVIIVGLLSGVTTALNYGIFLVGLCGAFFMGAGSSHRMLALFAGIIIALLSLGMISSGELAKWSVLGVGLFCSIMWSNIFSLAIEGLGSLKSQASSLLVMAISGGAVLPPVQGAVADHFGIQHSFIVPTIAFAYVAFYGLYGYRVGRASAKAPAALNSIA